MVAEARGSIFRRKDGRYFIYLPKELVEDTGFPLPCDSSLPVTIHFRPGEPKLIVEKTEKPTRMARRGGR